MIVARYFSTIRHPPVLVASASSAQSFSGCSKARPQNSRERVGWLIWGINSNYPLKSLAKSIGFVSLQQRVKRSSGDEAVASIQAPSSRRSGMFEDSTR